MQKVMLIVLVLAGVCWGAVTLVRDPMCTSKWYAYVPASLDSSMYARYEVTAPLIDGLRYPTYATLGGLAYGKVYQGFTIVPGMTEWAETGTWSAVTFTSGGSDVAPFVVRKTSTLNNYVDIAVPEGFNRISLVYLQTSSDSTTITVSWDDDSTTGLTTTSINTNGSTVTETVIATAASPDGVKALRFKKTAANTMYLIAVRCFNTLAVGNPATLHSDSLWRGDDLIDQTTGSWAAGQMRPTKAKFAGYASIICASTSTFDLAISHNISGVGGFTGGQNHFNPPNNAPYSYLSGEFTQGPAVFVDNDSAYSLWDNTNNPKRKVLSGANITFGSRGIALCCALLDNCDTAYTASENVTCGTATGKVGSAVTIKPAAAFETGLLAYRDIDSTNLTLASRIKVWMKSSIALNAGDLQLLIDDTSACASAIETLDLPAFAAGEWQTIDVFTTTPASLGAVISIGLNSTRDFGACTVTMDNIVWGRSDSPEMSWQFCFTPDGCNQSGALYFNTAQEVTAAYYCPMLSLDATTWGAASYKLTDGRTSVAMPAATQTLTGYQRLEIFVPINGYKVILSSLQPNTSVYLLKDTYKIYLKTNPSAMFNGSTAEDGDIYPFAGSVDVKTIEYEASTGRLLDGRF